jgi:hypothetical protein
MPSMVTDRGKEGWGACKRTEHVQDAQGIPGDCTKKGNRDVFACSSALIRGSSHFQWMTGSTRLSHTLHCVCFTR